MTQRPDALPGVAVDHADERGRRLGAVGFSLVVEREPRRC